ncbi:peptidase T [Fructilactobacillus fructivorans]|uniref:Peptidase T n=1 Tax=Fructilactobacillus fructivorans TaxID=1614 RepID=A0A0C1PRV5_9LACO|nr:peptidase T [Fructilactobacillus fructivorans]KID42611.1 Tripeptide aminopeptidase [Fructilactobacillus fructivorans]MCT0151837.1 peptidase T [Fructilactobacillus fructivorans]MCT2868034.1 peptidase T [Fructilactobacillus fructivorans]MCT2868686.1 peptidase T [Fructilactobacillus fructivorans]MCT2873383.1 peptidase T [Fructilactobacillus fructivorans]
MADSKQLLDRFLKYVRVNTRSNPNSDTIPSDPKEVDFLNELSYELKDIGMKNVRTNEKSGYVFADLPSNIDQKVPKIGFISHVDTADFNSEHVHPQIVKDYDGKTVINLDKDGKYKLDPNVFPTLKKYAGQTLVTTDGSTLLGADDKAGVAEIMTAMKYLIDHPEIKHGDIVIGFGPDEEIGTGADQFDVTDFGADFAYTVDGGPLGDLEYETFNAAAATIKFNGTDVHPGDAYGVMVNASQLAIDFHNQLPKDQRPENTKDRQGFYYLLAIDGVTDHAKLDYIIRDHDKDKFNERKEFIQKLVDQFNEKYGDGRVELEMHDEYYNMAEVIKKDMTPINIAKDAMNEVGIKPNIYPVRGGTDGSKISFLGIPTPNLFAGPENMHGRFEYVSLQTMEKAVDLIVKISEDVAKE